MVIKIKEIGADKDLLAQYAETVCEEFVEDRQNLATTKYDYRELLSELQSKGVKLFLVLKADKGREILIGAFGLNPKGRIKARVKVEHPLKRIAGRSLVENELFDLTLKKPFRKKPLIALKLAELIETKAKLLGMKKINGVIDPTNPSWRVLGKGISFRKRYGYSGLTFRGLTFSLKELISQQTNRAIGRTKKRRTLYAKKLK